MLVLSYGLGSLVAGSAELGQASLGAGGPQPSLSRLAWSQRVTAPCQVPVGWVIRGSARVFQRGLGGLRRAPRSVWDERESGPRHQLGNASQLVISWASPTSSLTRAPIMWTPTTGPLGWRTSFTNPRVFRICDFPLPAKS